MKLNKEKIKQALLANGLSTRRSERIAIDLVSRDLMEVEDKPKRSERIAEDLASRDLMEVEDKPKGKTSAVRSKDIIEVSKE